MSNLIDPFLGGGGGGGGASISFVANTAAQGTADGATSSAINTTGANLLIIALVTYSGVSTDAVISDNKSNKWIPLSTNSSSGARTRFYYAQSPTVGSGHTFSATGTGTYPAIAVSAWAGASTAPYDTENTSTFSGSTAAAGSVTPSTSGELVLAAWGDGITNDPTGVSVDSGFTILDTLTNVAGTAFGVSHAYLIESAATTKNPTLSGTLGAGSSVIACFKPAGAFVPTDISGLLSWHKADTSVYSDSGDTLCNTDWQEIIRWGDQSGNNNHFLQNDKPYYRTSILGGLKALHFNAQGISSMRLTNRLTTVKTIFIAFKRQGASNIYSVLLSDNSGSGSSPYVVMSDADYEQENIFSQTQMFPTNGALWYRNNVNYDPTSTARRLNLEVLIITTTSNTTLDSICRSVGGGSGQGAEIFEVGFYDTVLSSTDRGNLNTYLTSRWTESGTQNPEFIFDAGSITGLSNNDPVATWPDDTGNGHTATQSNGTYKPTYKTSALNSLPVVQFGGKFMNIATNSRISYVIAVYKAAGSTFDTYGATVGSPDGSRIMLFYSGTTTFYLSATNGLALGRRNKVTKWNNASLSAIDSWNCLSVSTSISHDSKSLTLGASDSGTWANDISIAEVRGYKDPLTVAQLESIEDALIAKYAL